VLRSRKNVRFVVRAVSTEAEAPVVSDGSKDSKVLLEVKGLTAVVADTGKEILRGVDLIIRQGEVRYLAFLSHILLCQELSFGKNVIIGI
jgi:hypothetical protein